MGGSNEKRDISPRPEWSFADVLKHAWEIYIGSGIESSGRRNVLYRIWAAMVGRERAIAELEHYILQQGGEDEAADSIGCSISTLRRLKKQFGLVGEQALVPMPLRLEKGEELRGKEERYLTDVVLGSGGMGIVYRVHGVNSSNDFAAKVLSSERFVISGVVRERFERECKIAQSFSSQHVVKSYETIHHRGTLVSIQELLNGRTLYDELSSDYSKVSNEQRLKWLIDITNGLTYLHDKGIVHRDISPRNCLFRSNGTIAVGDFGVARRTDDHTMTTFHERMGSLIYISPQQREHPHLADFRDDVYSLGQLAYHILTGISPHGGTQQIKELGYTEELDSLVKKMRNADPKQRPMSATECLKAL